jgi:hypothetical protein
MAATTMNFKLTTLLDRYFFSEKNLLVIGLIRIAMVTQLFSYVFQKRSVEFEDSLLNQLHQRSVLIEMLSKLFFHVNPSFFVMVFVAAAIGSFLGIFTRVSLFIFGICSIYVTGFPASLGVFDHVYCLVSQIMLLLAFIPGSTNLSLDRLFLFYQKYRKGERFFLYEPFFQRRSSVWGLRLILILLAYVYFAAGSSKVRYGGVRWVNGETLTFYMDGRASSAIYGSTPPMFLTDTNVKANDKWKDGFGLTSYSYGNRQYSKIGIKAGKFVSNMPALMLAMALGTVLFELAGFLILIDGWPRSAYLLSAMFMHVAIGFFMNLDFVAYRILDLLLIDWSWILKQWPLHTHKKHFQVYRQLQAFLLTPISKLDKKLA